MSIVDCSAAISDCLSAGADWSDWSVCFSKRGIVCDDSMAALLALNMQLAFRQALQCGVAKQSRDAALRLVDVATIVSAHSTLDKSTPFLLLEDIFEQQTRSEFLPTLSYLESNIQRLMNLDFKKSRTSTLALCNAILRRLSKAQDAEISGRLLIVLASALTLDERSGVNLAGRFASQSEATSVAPVGQVKAAAAKTESKSVDSNQSIDDEDFADAHDLLPSSSDSTPAQSARSFYDTLWSLQACFAEPNTLSSEAQLTIFTSACDVVLQAFGSIKLTQQDADAAAAITAQQSLLNNSSYFPKYLRSPRLLHLQLRDPEFRLHIALQMLITNQYLTLPICTKRPFPAPTGASANTLVALTQRAFIVVDSTPGGGASFVSSIRAMLQRESRWSAWKDTACPVLVTEPPAPVSLEDEESKKRSVDGVSAEVMAKRARMNTRPNNAKNQLSTVSISLPGGPLPDNLQLMGSAPLARLWSLPDAITVCAMKERAQVPSETSYLDKVAEEEDPENQYDDDCKSSREPRFNFQALRVLHGSGNMQLFLKSDGSALGAHLYRMKEKEKLAAKEEKEAGATTEAKTEAASESVMQVDAPPLESAPLQTPTNDSV